MGLTLWELLARSDTADVQSRGALADRRELEWAATLRGDGTSLERRLAWDSVDPGRVRAILGRPGSGCSEDPWMLELGRIYGATPQSTARVFETATDACRSVFELSAPIPFEEIFSPAILDARQRLQGRVGTASRRFDEGGKVALERSLLRRLSWVTAQALLAHFFVFRSYSPARVLSDLLDGLQTPSHYQGFLRQLQRGGIHRFFTAYPVAARLFVQVIDLWIDATVELVLRLDADYSSVVRSFSEGTDPGRVVDVATQVADMHGGGRTVQILVFESGLRIVYKPRTLAVEAAFHNFVAKLLEEADLVSLRTVRVEDHGDYGWSEFIESSPCEDEAEVERFYYGAGMALALVYALGGSDFHMENVIASGPHPVLIDLESLLTPIVFVGNDSGAAPGTIRASRFAMDSVLGTQMLPSIKTIRDGQVQAIGGIAGRANSNGTIDVTALADVNSDTMRLQRTRREAPTGHNVPSLAGRAVDASDFERQVVEGFSDCYRALMQCRRQLCGPGGFLEELSGLPIRFIPRHTSLYASLLERCLHPSYLKDGIERSIQLDALATPLLREGQRPLLWPMLAAERRALEQLDVPLFHVRSDSRTIELAPGRVVRDACEESPVGRARGRLGRLSEADLNTQVRLIHSAFAANRAVGFKVRSASVAGQPKVEVPPGGFDGTLETSERIGAALARQARPGCVLHWIAPTLIPVARRYSVQPSASLFDGACGIALFLAALHSVRPSTELVEVVRRVVREVGDLDTNGAGVLNSRVLDPGAGTGLASVALGLIRIAGYTDYDDALEGARHIVASLASLDATDWQQLDLLSGAAGVAFVMLELHGVVGEDYLLDCATRLGRYIVEQRQVDAATGLRTWTTWRGQPEIGLAGTTGIAHTLLLVASETGDDELREAARESLEYDHHVLRPWLAQEDRPHDREAAYVLGAAGLGTLSLRCGNDRRLVNRAIAATLATPWAGGDDFCSGASGRLDFLVSAARDLDRPDLMQAARTQAGELASRWQAKQARFPRWAGFEHPGLFQGQAGLGYALLRVASPHLVGPLFV